LTIETSDGEWDILTVATRQSAIRSAVGIRQSALTFIATIGLEVHAQLLTASKAFCGCSTAYGAPPNTNVCPVCLGHPGALPVLNRKAVELAVRTALAFGATVHPRSVFARKHYFYPDLPKGYQITQYDRPLATGGAVGIGSGQVPLVRIHLEEDAGKSLHDGVTRLDFNRSGVPLIEIVTDAAIQSAADAAACFSRIRETLVSLGVNDGNMEQGSLRCDANVSIRAIGSATLGTRTEIKNINSFRYVQRALQFEIDRHAALLSGGGRVAAETRTWDSATGETAPMRGKEDTRDYRYFPEPDLLPLDIDPALVTDLRATMPELRDAQRARFVTQYSLPPYDAEVLTQSAALASYFERVAAASGDPKASSNWIMGEALGRLNASGMDIAAIRITPERLAGLIRLAESGRITGPIAKALFERMFADGSDPEAIVEAEGLARVDDGAAIEGLVRQTLADNPKAVEQYRAGKRQAFGFLVGQAIKASAGRADPATVTAALRRILG
jgi:aspartyl-tRNA(Asn)/glutamyl-tRNA(Gln) amidotransferase subunit B